MKKLTVIVMIIAMTNTLFPVIAANWSDCESFPESCSQTDGLNLPKEQVICLSQFIIEGGESFLKANASYQEFLAFLERHSYAPDKIAEYGLLILNTIGYIDLAEENYLLLWTHSLNYTVSLQAYEKLINFDYESFSQENCLNDVVFDRLRNYLSCGDVHSVYHVLYSETQNIKSKLYALYLDFGTHKQPSIKLIWKANQMFYESLLFAQYISMVFYEL